MLTHIYSYTPRSSSYFPLIFGLFSPQIESKLAAKEAEYKTNLEVSLNTTAETLKKEVYTSKTIDYFIHITFIYMLILCVDWVDFSSYI